MIYLLDGSEFQLKYTGGINIMQGNLNMTEIIAKQLELASHTKELIHTQWLRGIGKTHELVKFAKENNYIVIHPRPSTIKELERYEHIYSSYQCSYTIKEETKIRDVVIDEGISDKEIKTLKEYGFKIITGYYTASQIKDERPFSEKVLETLVSEIEELTPKLEKLRKSEDYGTYKNLINAYKEILGLIQNHIQNYDIK